MKRLSVKVLLKRSTFCILAAMVLLLTSCTQSINTGDASKTGTVSRADGAADNKSELVVGVPTLGNESFTIRQRGTHLIPIVYEPLFRSFYINAQKEGKEEWRNYPDLAESYTVSEDGLTYSIKLRQGIQFHDGWGELTAEDAVYSFGLIADPANESSGNFYFADPSEGGYIKSYEAVDKYTLRVTLSRVYPMFIDDMTDQHLNMYCKKYIEEKGLEYAAEHPVGTGPWKLAEQVKGDYIKFERVENHWDHTPEFKYLTLKLVADSASQLLMLKNGQLDMIQIIPDQIEEVQASNLKIIEIPEKSMVSVLFGGQFFESEKHYDPTVPWANHSEEPLDSEWNKRTLKVRQALCHAIDYKAIQDVFMKGYAKDATMIDFIPGQPWCKDEWVPYEYNPEKARQLLAEAGYPNGFSKSIEFLISSALTNGVDTPKISQAVIANLEAIGLKVNKTVMDSNRLHETWRVQRDTAWRMSVNVSELLVSPLFGWPWNRTSYSDDLTIGEYHDIDTLVGKALTTVDDNKRTEVIQQVGQWCYDNYIERSLCANPIFWAAGPDVKGWEDFKYYESSRNFTQTFERVQKAD